MKIFQWFSDALGSLTILPLTGKNATGISTWSYLFYPIVGLLFGVLGLIYLHWLMPASPFAASWLLVVTWVILSGGRHLSGLARSVEGIAGSGTFDQRVAVLGKRQLGAFGVIAIAVVFVGKILAVVQGASLDARSLGLLILLVPAFARFFGVMLALESKSSLIVGGQSRPSEKSPVLIGGVVILGLLSLTTVALGLFLFLCGLFAILVVHQSSLRRLNGVFPPVIGAAVEISELVMLWGVVIAALCGLDLALL